MRTRSFKIIFLLCVVTLLLSCTKNAASSTDTSDDTPPVLKNLAISFAALNAEGMAGDFDFKKTLTIGGGINATNCSATNKLFYEFGAAVTAKLLPTFEYKVIDTASVLSPIAGTIKAVETQTAGDYAIEIVPSSNSTWTLELDHVLSLTVAVGDSVVAGQVVGKPGAWDSTNHQGRVEIMLYKPSTHVAYCPFDYFDSNTKTAYLALLKTHMDEWEASTCKNATIWDRTKMATLGCICKTMSTDSDVNSCID